MADGLDSNFVSFVSTVNAEVRILDTMICRLQLCKLSTITTSYTNQ